MFFAKLYVYKCKLQSSMPVLTVFHNILKDRYNIETERYSSFILGNNADFKIQWLPIILNPDWVKTLFFHCDIMFQIRGWTRGEGGGVHVHTGLC